jgi:hypothetical protein
VKQEDEKSPKRTQIMKTKGRKVVGPGYTELLSIAGQEIVKEAGALGSGP